MSRARKLVKGIHRVAYFALLADIQVNELTLLCGVCNLPSASVTACIGACRADMRSGCTELVNLLHSSGRALVRD